MRPNKLRELLKSNKPTLSTHIHTTWPSVVAAIGHTGLYDYVEFVGEYVQALRDIVVAIMIEKPGTVDTLEDVLSVKGVDMVQWGGSDYSMGIGRAGERYSPELRVVERRVFETAIKMGVPPRAEIATADQAKYFLDMGVRHFSVGTDITILHQWWKSQGEDMRKALGH